ncbi:VOC family protein [Sulfitobacter sabulilitoris]|uniref:VOC family protein n=1 Tax=Sulfitobacter sabulilitoris TaxID=2562655 RepID=A0A5S3PP79_9RHOB|nr:VOC family protein [Sulfitobacter sabulilitoris]TMM55400.1 VOC family protein [Sulfitobacter sabulilitoris]
MEPTIYLFFKGKCLGAMCHYAEVLNGKISGVFRNEDVPDAESRMPGGDDLVVNMMMTLGSATVMASNNAESMYEKTQGFRVSIAPRSLEDFDRIFEVLAKNAEHVEMAPAETFWAERFATFIDRYGTPWMLNYEGNRSDGAPA